MRNIVLGVILLLPLSVLAQPSSRIAWTPEILSLVKAGQVEKGKQLAAACTGCHGKNGNSPMPHVPSLAGQLATYLYKQLQDYADGSRDQFVMTSIAKGLSAQNRADLAAWFSSQELVTAKTSGTMQKLAENLVKNGDDQRTLAPCEVCHASDGLGSKQAIPALAGQQAMYLTNTLQAFKSEKRKNDIYSRMRSIARLLTDQEMKELGKYYQQMD